MIKLWKMITGSLHDKNFEAKTTTDGGKENGTEDTRRGGETTYDDAPSRRRSSSSCYVSYDGDTDDSAGAATCCVTSATYNATASDFYIGVAGHAASTIYLPTAVADGKVIIVKAEMRPPIGTRKITIMTKDGSLIDGYAKREIQVSHECCSVIRHNGNWHVIGK